MFAFLSLDVRPAHRPCGKFVLEAHFTPYWDRLHVPPASVRCVPFILPKADQCACHARKAARSDLCESYDQLFLLLEMLASALRHRHSDCVPLTLLRLQHPPLP